MFDFVKVTFLFLYKAPFTTSIIFYIRHVVKRFLNFSVFYTKEISRDMGFCTIFKPLGLSKFTQFFVTIFGLYFQKALAFFYSMHYNICRSLFFC